jgi:hypothetical protein
MRTFKAETSNIVRLFIIRKVLGSIPGPVLFFSRKIRHRPQAMWLYTPYLHVPYICIWNTGLRIDVRILVCIIHYLQAPVCVWLGAKEKTKESIPVTAVQYNGEDQTKLPRNPHESLSLSRCCHILTRIYGLYVNNSRFNTGRCRKGTVSLVIVTRVVIGGVRTGGSTFFSPPKPTKQHLFDSHITRSGAIIAWRDVRRFATSGAQRRLR